MRVVYELERSADLMVNIAKTTWRLHPFSLDPVSRSIVEQLCEQVVVQTRVAVNAFVDLDPSGAAALVDMDDTVDELHKALPPSPPRGRRRSADRRHATVPRAVQLALVAHHYERIGDHAVNIAEQVYRVTNGRRRTPRSAPGDALGPLSKEPEGVGVGRGVARPHTLWPTKPCPDTHSRRVVPASNCDGGRCSTTTTLEAVRFEAVALLWRAGKRGVKTGGAIRRPVRADSAISGHNGRVTTTPAPDSRPDRDRARRSTSTSTSCAST